MNMIMRQVSSIRLRTLPWVPGFSSRVRRDTSVSATGRQIFGIRPKMPETALEKSLVPEVKNNCALNPLSPNSDQH